MDFLKLKRTSLYEAHKRLKAKMINFNGWEMPLQYSGILDEHRSVRSSVGIFDVSHMGEIIIKGKDAFNLLQFLITNDVSKLNDNGCQYSVMCYPDGGIVDDLIIYRFSSEEFMLCVNASNTEKDYQWILGNLDTAKLKASVTNVSVDNISDTISQISIQGKSAEVVLQKISDIDLSVIRHYCFKQCNIDSAKSIVSRTGYTGEDGFEIYTKDNVVEIWDRLLENGKEYSIKPVGLGARDTLRLEMKYPLYGNDINENTTPLEADLGWVVKFDKEDFIGKDVLKKQKETGAKQKLVGFEIIGKGIPRPHYPIFKEKERIGEVTSGTLSPSLGRGIGIGYVKTEASSVGEEIDIEIRGGYQKAKIVSTPFYKRDKDYTPYSFNPLILK